jgi:hypothetical protein
VPRVQVYQDNQVDPVQTTRARFQPADNDGGVGAAIAQGAQQLGGVVSKHATETYETQRHEEAAASAFQLQEHLRQTDEYERAWEDGKAEGATPSGSGLSEAILNRFDDGVAGITSGIRDKTVKDRLLMQALEYRRGYVNRTTRTEETKLGNYFADQNKQTTNLAANRLRSSNDPEDLSTTVADLTDIIGSYQLTDDKKAILRQFTTATVTRAFFDGQIERNPANAIALIDRGLASSLDPNVVDQLRDEANAAIQSIQARARAEAAHQTAVQKDQLGAVEQQLNAGGGTAQDRLALAQRYRQLGDESKAAQWELKAVEFSAVQGTKDLTVPQMDAAISTLTAKQGQGGLTGAEAATLSGLKDQRAQAAARLTQSGGALLQLEYATGKPLSPLDFRNPATIQRRASEARAAAQKYGRKIEPLLPDEARQLQDMVASGDPAQQTRALNAIGAFGAPDAIRGAAGQITDSGDGAFRVAATRVLAPNGPQVVGHILQGGTALKANPQVWQKPNDSGKLVSAEDDARALFAEYLPALAGLGPNAANDTYEAAKAFYASKMNAAGQTQFAGGAWRNAIETVIGAYSNGGTSYGGSALYQGAHRVVIPEGWTGEGLFRRLARAKTEDWVTASGGRDPMWPDGSKVYPSQLRELVPVWMGGTTYAFRSPKTNNLLPSKRGGPFTIDAAKVPWR